MRPLTLNHQKRHVDNNIRTSKTKIHNCILHLRTAKNCKIILFYD